MGAQVFEIIQVVGVVWALGRAMAQKQIEGAKTPLLQRMGASLTSAMVKRCSRGTPLYSLGYGVGVGIVLSGMVYAGRSLNILLFDHEYYKLQSRKRYFEKQLLFSKEQEEANEAHYLAALAAEYDPAACRAPFKALDAKYRF